MAAPRAHRPLFLTTLLQSFFIVPFWDAQSLLVLLKENDNPALRHRLVELVVALAVALAGWVALAWLIPGVCCRISTVLYPNEAVSRLIGSRLMPTIGMLAFIALGGVVITALLVGLSTVSGRLAAAGGVGKVVNTLRCLLIGVLASPPGHIGVLAVLLLGVRLEWLSVPVGRSALGLILPSFSVALLPALVAARYVERMLPDPVHQPEQAVTLAATSFYRQASWLVGGLAVAEAVFGVDGLGRLLVEALRLGDKALILPLLLLFMVATLLCRLHVLRLERAEPTVSSTTQALATQAGTQRWVQWVGLICLLIMPLVLAYSGRALPRPDPTAIYAAPSNLHPWGTDGLGLDILGRVRQAVRQGWLIALTGALVSIGLSGWWISAMAWMHKHQRTGLAHGLHALAEAIILLAPAPVAVGLFLSFYMASPQPGIMLGVFAGIVLAPRLAWGVGGTGYARLHTAIKWQRIGHQLASAGFAALQMVFMAILVTGQSASSGGMPGGLLAAYQDMIAGASLLHGGPYLRLALVLALPGMVLAWGWYLLVDALTGPDDSDELAALFS
jgi:peptide/nickel transport system permease protein